ncbi:hypothetical protein MKZ08_14175 [Viridibacillus sp. FSL R5-0477]|uniref:hypothetical protein n=1 Tax=Viridibacillus TaxID=496496 RepID=UPI00117F3C1B|nr:hypothetical protein [Viridibacillus arenosi]
MTFLVSGAKIARISDNSNPTIIKLPNNIQVRRTSLLISRCMRGTLYDWLLFGADYDLVQESDQFIRIFLDG